MPNQAEHCQNVLFSWASSIDISKPPFHSLTGTTEPSPPGPSLTHRQAPAWSSVSLRSPLFLTTFCWSEISFWWTAYSLRSRDLFESCSYGPIIRASESWHCYLLGAKGHNNWALQCWRKVFYSWITDSRMSAVTCCHSLAGTGEPNSQFSLEEHASTRPFVLLGSQVVLSY
jgi:hypothetical protein